MRSPENLGGTDYGTEVRRDPEVDELLEFLGVYQKIQEIMAWLVEASVEADFAIKAVRRGQMHLLIQQLGLDPESPDAFVQLEDMRAGLSDRTMHPQPRVDVPEVGFFKSRIKGIVAEQDRFGNSLVESYVFDGVADIVGLARYGHTDWQNVASRAGGQHVSEWVHGIARIMADPVAYQAEFAGLGIDGVRRTADHIEVAEDWSIQNGRHRSLATRSLGEVYVLEAGMSQWIDVTVEQP